MNGTLILDSNAIIDLLDGRGEVSTIMDGYARILIPAVVLGELKAGCPGMTKREAMTRELIEKLLHTPEAAACQIDCSHLVYLRCCFFYNRTLYNDHAGYDVGIMTTQYCGAAVI